MMLQEIWGYKIDETGKKIATILFRVSYTDGEIKKVDRVIEIDCPEKENWILDLSMKFLAKTLGEQGIMHLVDEYCKIHMEEKKQ
jgi:hypothetical protein